MHSLLLISGTIVLLIGPVVYGVSIFRGRSRPHRLTRFTLMVVHLLGFFSAWAAHANTGALILTGTFAATGFALFGMSLWRGMSGTSPFDWPCFGLAIVGLVAWQLSGSALVGLWMAILSHALAYVPAVIKTWKHPHTEGPWVYTLCAIASFLTLAAYPLSASSAFQIYIVFNSLTMLFCIYRRQIFGKVDPETTV